MITTSHPDDVPWSGEVSFKPTPNSETTATGYVFHDISWKQKIISLGSFLTLNLVGRSQERLQVARGLLVIQVECTELKRVLSIQVDGLYLQPPKREFKKLQRNFRGLRYCDLHKISSPLVRSVTHVRQEPSRSIELEYKANECEPRFPGGTLKVAEHVDPPYHEQLAWKTYTEPKEGPDDFVEKVLEHVRKGLSFTCLGAPGTGKSKGILAKS